MIYTKTGDKGTTSLVGGERVRKDHARVEAYGTLDELNSHVGLLAEMCRPQGADYYGELKRVQRNLFTIQTLLATEDEAIYSKLPQLKEDEVVHMEQQIDAIVAVLPKLNSFVIAGGTLIGAQCHICRTVCRRAERRAVTLSEQVQVEDVLLRYLNRLSDYLFVLGRQMVVASGVQEDLYIS